MEVRSEKLIAVRCGREDNLNRLYHILPEYATAKILTVKHKTPRRLSSSGCSVCKGWLKYISTYVVCSDCAVDSFRQEEGDFLGVAYIPFSYLLEQV